MDRVDRLIDKAKPKRTIHNILQSNNPYLSMTYQEIRDYMRPQSGKELPAPGTLEHDKYMYALIQARRNNERK